MSDTGNSKLCSGEVDCGEDHQGLDVARDLRHCKTADSNPNSCPGSEENVELRSSSDSQPIVADVRGLSDSTKECGHLENQNPEEISLSSMLQGDLHSSTLQSCPRQALHDFNSLSIPIPNLRRSLNSLRLSTSMQLDMLVQLLNIIGGDHVGSTVSSSSSQANSMAMRPKTALERESELKQQISELKGVVSTLSAELLRVEEKNAQLENELMEKEERKRKEETKQSEN